MAEMKQHIAALQEALARSEKNSSNSSKPPSSDIVKPPKPAAKRGKKRRPDGQPGHAQYERTLSIEQARGDPRAYLGSVSRLCRR